MMNPRPIGKRKVVQMMVAVFILVWATQTLLIQWGYGAIIVPAGMQTNLTPQEPQAPAQTITMLEVRAEAKIDGSEVTLRQVCRWAHEDDGVMSGLVDVVVSRLGQNLPVRQIDVAQIKQALHDAGANLSALHFSGSATCAVRRSEVDDATFIRLLKQIERDSAKTQATTQPGGVDKPIASDTLQTPLRDLLVTDLCDRLKIPAERVQITFDPRDEPTLALAEPRCRFEIDSSRALALGEVAWDIVIHTDTTQRRATIAAKALVWEEQVMLTRPLSKGQTIISTDVREQRVLVDNPTAQALSKRDDAVGQVAGRDFARGDVIAGADLRLPTIVRAGQFVTVTLRRAGGASVESIARAMDNGAKGDSIRARNEATGEVYQVLITSPAAGQITDINKDIASTN